MSKYDAVWRHIHKSGKDRLELTFAEIETIAGIPVDHSFLSSKKELLTYGYQVEHIFLKKQTVIFTRLEEMKLD